MTRHTTIWNETRQSETIHDIISIKCRAIVDCLPVLRKVFTLILPTTYETRHDTRHSETTHDNVARHSTLYRLNVAQLSIVYRCWGKFLPVCIKYRKRRKEEKSGVKQQYLSSISCYTILNYEIICHIATRFYLCHVITVVYVKICRHCFSTTIFNCTTRKKSLYMLDNCWFPNCQLFCCKILMVLQKESYAVFKTTLQ